MLSTALTRIGGKAFSGTSVNLSGPPGRGASRRRLRTEEWAWAARGSAVQRDPVQGPQHRARDDQRPPMHAGTIQSTRPRTQTRGGAASRSNAARVARGATVNQRLNSTASAPKSPPKASGIPGRGRGPAAGRRPPFARQLDSPPRPPVQFVLNLLGMNYWTGGQRRAANLLGLNVCTTDLFLVRHPPRATGSIGSWRYRDR